MRNEWIEGSAREHRLGIRSPEMLVCDLCGCAHYDFLFHGTDGDYIQCRNCRLIYGTADETGLAEEYDGDYDALLAPEAAEKRKRSGRWHAKSYDRVRAFEKYRRAGRYLEIGCAHGDFLKVVEENGWETVGIEISDSAAKFAREHYGLDVRTGTIESLAEELPAASFDVIWAANLLEHVVSPNAFLANVQRLLSPGGVFIGSTLNFDSWGYRIAGSKWQYTHSSRIHRFVFSPDTLARYCQQNGLEMIGYETFGFKFVSKYAEKSWYSPFVRLAEQAGAALAHWLNQGHRIEIVARRKIAKSGAIGPNLQPETKTPIGREAA